MFGSLTLYYMVMFFKIGMGSCIREEACKGKKFEKTCRYYNCIDLIWFDFDIPYTIEDLRFLCESETHVNGIYKKLRNICLLKEMKSKKTQGWPYMR